MTKIEEQKLTIGDLIAPGHMDTFREELRELLEKMYMKGYEKGYEDAKQFALNYLNNDKA